MSRERKAGLFLSMCLGLAPCQSAWALLESCAVSTVPVNFGIYNPLSATPDMAMGTVSVTCTVTLIAFLESWTVALSTGNSNNYTSRSLTNGSSILSYNLYTSAAYTNVWGNGSGSTSLVSGSATLAVGTTKTDYTVYGVIPAGQDSAAGAYTDAIVVTLNY